MNMTGHILIIDDEAILRKTLARILQQAGFEVTTAENAEQGLAFLKPPALIWCSLICACPAFKGWMHYE